MWDGAGTRRVGSNAPTKLTATRSRDRARCEKRLFWGAIYILKATVLTRQALDTRKKRRFSQVETYTPSFTYHGFRYVAVRCGQTPSFSFAVLFLIRKTDDLPRQARDKRATKIEFKHDLWRFCSCFNGKGAAGGLQVHEGHADGALLPLRPAARRHRRPAGRCRSDGRRHARYPERDLSHHALRADEPALEHPDRLPATREAVRHNPCSTARLHTTAAASNNSSVHISTA